MKHNSEEIVELLDEDGWTKTTMADACFICSSFNYDEAKFIRRIEGSIDKGVSYKTWYADEFKQLSENTYWAIIWRVKEK